MSNEKLPEEIEECVNRMCGLLLIKCLEEETLHLGLNVDYKNNGLKCRFHCEFEVIGR